MSDTSLHAGNLPVIDFHSHILPGIDDGSRSREMSASMLRISREMGVDVLLATPHFYGFRESVSDFLRHRADAWKRLSPLLGGDTPAVRLGAEVAFYSGLTRLEQLDDLCIEGTRLLLLEMPMAAWTSYELNALSTLCLDRGYQIILAHFERFVDLQTDKDLLKRILRLPMWIQINAGSLLPLTRRRRVLKLFESGMAHLLGSDCHNDESRPPNMGPARALLQRKLGDRVLEEMDALGNRLLGPAAGLPCGG